MTCFMEIPVFSRLDMVLSAAARSASSVRRTTAVIAEGVHGGRRDGVDRVRTDQLFDVQHITIFWIFGAGAGPEQPLACAPLAARAFHRGPSIIFW